MCNLLLFILLCNINQLTVDSTEHAMGKKRSSFGHRNMHFLYFLTFLNQIASLPCVEVLTCSTQLIWNRTFLTFYWQKLRTVPGTLFGDTSMFILFVLLEDDVTASL